MRGSTEKNRARLCAALALGLLGGCSIRSIATGALADTFAAQGDAYGRDDDPELVREAVPFALKTMEQVLDAQPRHVGLLTALARGFTQYGYAFVQQDADQLAERDVVRAKEVEGRARRMYLRARDYGLRGLEIDHPGFRAAFVAGSAPVRAQALAGLKKKDVPLLYWTAAPWALAVASGKDNMKLVGELPAVEQLMARAFELDESWDGGAIHEFYVTYDGARTAADGGGPERAKAHLDRALALAENKRLSPLVSYAESVAVAAQDRKEFTRLLEQVAGADLEKSPPDRLANIVAQRRARWLLSRASDLFVE